MVKRSDRLIHEDAILVVLWLNMAIDKGFPLHIKFSTLFAMLACYPLGERIGLSLKSGEIWRGRAHDQTIRLTPVYRLLHLICYNSHKTPSNLRVYYTITRMFDSSANSGHYGDPMDARPHGRTSLCHPFSR